MQLYYCLMIGWVKHKLLITCEIGLKFGDVSVSKSSFLVSNKQKFTADLTKLQTVTMIK